MKTEEYIKQELNRELGLVLPNRVSQQELLDLLCERVTAILAKGPEVFFQLMYRLDISEKRLNEVLDKSDAPRKIAELIYERQLQKAESRLKNRPETPDDVDNSLKW